MKKITVLIVSFLLSTTLYSKSTTQLIGDVLSVGVPLSAYANSYFLDDIEGQKQFYKSYATAIGTTLALKYTIKERRPDSDEEDSFPSGHTSSAFSGASFIHKRYGWKYALLPYVAAIYTGYSRIHSHRHYRKDVYAGALLGIASSWYFTTPYKNCKVQVASKNGRYGMQLSYEF
jgi:membrane-associated phospholipid phosphatase